MTLRSRSLSKVTFPTLWFQGLPEKEKAEMYHALMSSIVSKRLLELLEKFSSELSVNRGDYENPAWAYKQAHFNGELAAYTKIISLLRPKEQHD